MSDANLIQTDGQSVVDTKKKIEEPAHFKVLLHNDDYTTMDFVVSILCNVFHKNLKEATRIMLLVHNHGVGECGTFTREIAESRVNKVKQLAYNAGFPLKCTMEKI